MKRDLVTIADLNRSDIEHILALAKRLKGDLKAGRAHRWLEGATMAMIFEKPSLRTRVTFETGMNQLGGLAIYLAPDDIRLGEGESVTDIARNLSRWVDIIMARTHSHLTVVELALNSEVPVINGLSDLSHPCQVLADCLTLSELRSDLSSLSITFVGDGNNVVHSWLLAASCLGLNFTLVCPPGYEPDEFVLEKAQEDGTGTITITNDLTEGTRGADVLYTDVWTSMGQEQETARRLADFAPYQINQEVLADAAKDALVMHCLPAHRGEEITSEVLDGPNSIVLDQAENRLHLQKALVAWMLEAKEGVS
ncbi:MAG: ornithine carbamoyltransferase [Deltaproteobacteria bacterium]